MEDDVPRNRNGVSTDFPSSQEEIKNDDEFGKEVNTVGDRKTFGRYPQAETDGGVSTQSTQSPVTPVETSVREVCNLIQQEKVWNDTVHELEPHVGETEFTVRDLAESRYDHDNYSHMDLEAVEEELDAAVERGILYRQTRTVDLDKTTEDELYADVTFYGLADGPMGI